MRIAIAVIAVIAALLMLAPAQAQNASGANGREQSQQLIAFCKVNPQDERCIPLMRQCERFPKEEWCQPK